VEALLVSYSPLGADKEGEEEGETERVALLDAKREDNLEGRFPRDGDRTCAISIDVVLDALVVLPPLRIIVANGEMAQSMGEGWKTAKAQKRLTPVNC
jgi:hypothetical protein